MVYKIYYVKRGPSRDRFLGSYPEVYLDINEFYKKGIKYVIVSSLLVNNTGKLFMPLLEKHAELVKEFSPYKIGIKRIVPREVSILPAAAFTMRELWDRERFGPVLRIYRLKKYPARRKK